MTRLCWLCLLAVGVGSSAYCVLAAQRLGPTFDEPFYVAKGLHFWRTGSHQPLMRAGTMPLPVDVQTFPVWVWEQVRGKRFDPVGELQTVLPVARAANLVFWWLLLFFGGRLANLWGGPAAGRWATALLACEPNLLAHATLATTDIALTAGVLAAVYRFAAGRDGSWWRRVLVPGVAAGLAVACKASAVTYVPLACLCLVPLCPRGRGVKGEGVATVLVAAVTLFLVCGTDWRTEPAFIKWANTLPDDATGVAVRWTADHLHIFPNAGEGLVQQVKHNVRGHGCSVLGEWHPRAVWYYFPVVLSAKLPVPLLVLLLVRPKCWRNPAGLIAVAYLIFSLSCRVQIGVRLVFPLVAMLNIAAVCGLTGWPALSESGISTRSRRERATLWIWLSLTALVSLQWWPDGLRYSNELWGGREKAADVLTDSNHDWGQGLPELREWWEQSGSPRGGDEREPAPPLRLWYYGTDPACLLPPFELVQVNQMPRPGLEEVKRRTAGGYFAVGQSFFTACPDRRPGTLAVLAWLSGQTPVAVVGPVRVYWIPTDPEPLSLN
jgi:hypothetical protein